MGPATPHTMAFAALAQPPALAPLGVELVTGKLHTPALLCPCGTPREALPSPQPSFASSQGQGQTHQSIRSI